MVCRQPCAGGTLASFAITVPLVFGWLRFEADGQHAYRPVVAGVPQPMVDKIYAATEDALKAPAVKAQFDREGATVLKMSSAEFTDYIKSEIAKWERVVKEGNFKTK